MAVDNTGFALVDDALARSKLCSDPFSSPLVTISLFLSNTRWVNYPIKPNRKLPASSVIWPAMVTISRPRIVSCRVPTARPLICKACNNPLRWDRPFACRIAQQYKLAIVGIAIEFGLRIISPKRGYSPSTF